MRLLAAAVLLILAAAPAAAKPAAGTDDPARRMYRLQGVGACTADNHPGVKYDLRVDNIFADCDCAIDRHMAGRDLADLPRIVPGQTRGILDRLYAQCRTDRLAGTAARSDSPEVAPVAPAAAPATLPPARPDASAFEPSSAAPPPNAAASPSFEPLAWLDRTGLPRWAWIAIPVGFLVLLALLGRRRRRGDLLGPPPSMRQGARPPPRSPPPGRRP